MTPSAMPYRALLRQVKGPLRPSTSGNMFSLGTGQSSRWIMPVMDARSPVLFLMAGVSSVPAGHCFLSTRKPRILPVSCSLAHTTSTSAMGEFVIHVLDPRSRK